MAPVTLSQAFAYNGGYLVTPKQCFATLDERSHSSTPTAHGLLVLPIFKLRIIGEKLRKQNAIVGYSRAQAQEAQQQLSAAGPDEVEYLAANIPVFTLSSTEQWNDWDGLSCGREHRMIYDTLERSIDEYASRAKRAIVVGCGTGALLDRLQQRGIAAVGIEKNEKNCEIAKRKGRDVRCMSVSDLTDVGMYDLAIDAGVLTAGVIPIEESAPALDAILRSLNGNGTFMQIPMTRSLVTSSDLRKGGFDVMSMTEPKNLFTYDYPKQVYIATRL